MYQIPSRKKKKKPVQITTLCIPSCKSRNFLWVLISYHGFLSATQIVERHQLCVIMQLRIRNRRCSPSRHHDDGLFSLSLRSTSRLLCSHQSTWIAHWSSSGFQRFWPRHRDKTRANVKRKWVLANTERPWASRMSGAFVSNTVVLNKLQENWTGMVRRSDFVNWREGKREKSSSWCSCEEFNNANLVGLALILWKGDRDM